METSEVVRYALTVTAGIVLMAFFFTSPVVGAAIGMAVGAKAGLVFGALIGAGMSAAIFWVMSALANYEEERYENRCVSKSSQKLYECEE